MTNGAHPPSEVRPGTVPERRSDGFLHRRLSVGEVTLHVAEARPAGHEASAKMPADIPLVVMCHGFPEFWWSWRHQMTALSQAGVWAVAPDMRGYNESDKPEGVGSYEVEKLAGDVAGLIRALGRERAFIVGHDWGGMVSWAFAQTYPEMVERLAILNVPHPLQMTKGLRTLKQLMKSWYMFYFQLPFGIPERSLAQSDYAGLRKLFEEDGFPREEIEHYVDAMRVPGATTGAINWYRAAIRRVLTGRTPESKRIDCPTLVIWGEKDRFLGKEISVPPERFVPNQRVVHIPEATHWVQNAAIDRVNALLLEHVKS
ncbi:MAG: alpha/beta hydrolase [Deltaproteobacteria bacterium]|nr:alpha/beta hydrolase [Deltaproteobacteria bacterium]